MVGQVFQRRVICGTLRNSDIPDYGSDIRSRIAAQSNSPNVVWEISVYKNICIIKTGNYLNVL